MSRSRISYLYSKLLTFLSIAIMYIFVVPNFAPPRHHSAHQILYIDSVFNKKETNDIVEAVLEWNKSTNKTIKFDIEKLVNLNKINKKDGIVITKINDKHPEVILIDWKTGNVTLAYYNPADIQYIAVINSRIERKQYKKVIMHELGHAIGLNHDDKMGTLMYPIMDLAADHITNADINNVCKIHKCNIKQL